MVDLARTKARKRSENPDENEIINTEPYPLVMDAPFSNVDEIHIENIAKILPDIAEQVILIIMEKDWNNSKHILEDKLGAKYEIIKFENKETFSKVKGDCYV